MTETIRHISGEEAEKNLGNVVDAFDYTLRVTPPWELGIAYAETKARWRRLIRDDRANVVVAEHDQNIIGMSIYRNISIRKIITSGDFILPEEITSFLSQVGQAHSISHMISLEYTFVVPAFQRQGIARGLRKEVLRKIEEDYPQGAVVFAAHRSDNPGIIKISEEQGLQRTGITTSEEDVVNGYWYKIVNPHPPLST